MDILPWVFFRTKFAGTTISNSKTVTNCCNIVDIFQWPCCQGDDFFERNWHPIFCFVLFFFKCNNNKKIPHRNLSNISYLERPWNSGRYMRVLPSSRKFGKPGKRETPPCVVFTPHNKSNDQSKWRKYSGIKMAGSRHHQNRLVLSWAPAIFIFGWISWWEHQTCGPWDCSWLPSAFFYR